MKCNQWLLQTNWSILSIWQQMRQGAKRPKHCPWPAGSSSGPGVPGTLFVQVSHLVWAWGCPNSCLCPPKLLPHDPSFWGVYPLPCFHLKHRALVLHGRWGNGRETHPAVVAPHVTLPWVSIHPRVTGSRTVWQGTEPSSSSAVCTAIGTAGQAGRAPQYRQHCQCLHLPSPGLCQQPQPQPVPWI